MKPESSKTLGGLMKLSNDIVETIGQNQLQFLKFIDKNDPANYPINSLENIQFSLVLEKIFQLEKLETNILVKDKYLKHEQIPEQSICNSAIPGLVGKTVKALTDKIVVSNNRHITLGYWIHDKVKSGNIIFEDKNSVIAFKYKLYDFDLSIGEHEFTLNIKDHLGKNLINGEYALKVNAIDFNEELLNIRTYFLGTIESISFTPNGTVLIVNKVKVPFENILSISASNIDTLNIV